MARTPYTNFHDLNLNWIIEKIKTVFTPDNPPPYPVTSVNQKTGAVELKGTDIPVSANDPQTIANALASKYEKPASGIPASDLAPGVIPDPASIIDDNAGSQVYDKTWSAHKLFQQEADILDLQNDKQDAPASAGTAGQVLGLNASLQPEWVDMPETQLIEAVDDWLSENITNPSNPPLDRSLSLANACAPADMLGDLEKALNSGKSFSNYYIVRHNNNTIEGVSYDFNFEEGKTYILTNVGLDTVNITTRQDDTRMDEIITGLTPGNSVIFVAQNNANKLRIYWAERNKGLILVNYGLNIDITAFSNLNVINNNITFPVKCYVCGFNVSTKTETKRSDRLTSDFIELKSGNSINIEEFSGYQTKVYIFNSNDNESWESETQYSNITTFINKSLFTKYVRIGIKKNSEGNIIPLDVKGLKTTIIENFNITYDWINPFYVRSTNNPECITQFNSDTRFSDIHSYYNRLCKTFDTDMTKINIGTSQLPENEWAEIDSNTYPLDIYTIRGKQTNTATENRIILCSGLHGDDWNHGSYGDGIEGVCALAYFITKLLYEYKTDPFLKYLRNNCNIIIYPVMNPWGFQNGYRCNGRGVDLNRNFNIDWVSESSYGFSSGDYPGSEAETSAWSDFLNNNIGVSGAKFLMEVHTRGGNPGLIPNDNRWLLLRGLSNMLDLSQKIGNSMIMQFGGNGEYNYNTIHGQAYFYASEVFNIPSMEPECFRSYADDPNTKFTLDCIMQNVGFIASVIKNMTMEYIV